MTSSPRRIQRRYDHRLRKLVQTSGDVELAVRHGVPRSTARGWLTSTPIDVVTLDFLDLETVRLQHELIVLRRRIRDQVEFNQRDEVDGRPLLEYTEMGFPRRNSAVKRLPRDPSPCGWVAGWATEQWRTAVTREYCVNRLSQRR